LLKSERRLHGLLCLNLKKMTRRSRQRADLPSRRFSGPVSPCINKQAKAGAGWRRGRAAFMNPSIHESKSWVHANYTA
jgi:hypothetical protein